uniref:ATP synthase F0 subunit 8 n=1 Tax=Gymnodraco acuticeps TaxID=8218 RepID=A0A1P8DI92_GYMAC|nr:ATP synthase F0 subunit 8 [Gymnodraco acuticeps]APU88614.1 ATP synthase F0 subunit 8 [Gymnodraco acuticeps]QSJ54440.1 ATP synthase F0 subunit 8 [Gymnodraco acuticeps]
MPQNFHASCFAMLTFSLMLYFTTGHTKIMGHTNSPKPSPWPTKFLNWQKWAWPWS